MSPFSKTFVGKFLGGPVVRTLLRAWVKSLVGELRSRKLRSEAKKNKNKNKHLCVRTRLSSVCLSGFLLFLH